MPCNRWKVIRKKVIEKGTRIEKKEHKWASKKVARRIATDHVRKEGLRAYGRK